MEGRANLRREKTIVHQRLNRAVSSMPGREITNNNAALLQGCSHKRSPLRLHKLRPRPKAPEADHMTVGCTFRHLPPLGGGASGYNPGTHRMRRDGRVAEGGGLLNRYRVKSSIGGSNPPLSAIALNSNIQLSSSHDGYQYCNQQRQLSTSPQEIIGLVSFQRS